MIKKGRFRIFLSLLILGAFVSSFLEAQTVVPTPERYYGSGTVILKSGERMEARGLLFEGGKLTFEVKNTEEKKTCDLAEVESASRYKRYALEGAIAGGSALLLLGLVTLLGPEDSADPYGNFWRDFFRANAARLVVNSLVVGGLVGALIGSFFKTEQTVFQNGQIIVKLGFQPSIRGAATGTGLEFLHLRMSF